ncbi:MAG: hypothetical protein ACP5K5_01865 [Candidatus Micrarchaeia archaeon]
MMETLKSYYNSQLNLEKIFFSLALCSLAAIAITILHILGFEISIWQAALLLILVFFAGVLTSKRRYCAVDKALKVLIVVALFCALAGVWFIM